MEILPGLYCLPVTIETLPPHRATNMYIMIHGESALVLDAVSPLNSEPQQKLAEMGVRSIQTALITHSHGDHHRGLEAFLKKFGGEIVCHHITHERLRDAFKEEWFGRDLEGGEILENGDFKIKALHTPGHCTDHICFYLENEKVLFTGDTILGWGTSIISPPEGDMTAYMKTLEDLMKLDIAIICPGHGPLIQENANDRIKWYHAHRLMREKLVLDALSDALLTPYEIAERIYSEEDFKMHGRDLLPRAARSVLAHLEKLEKEGKVFSSSEGGATKYGAL
ncbi:MAG: MBL fold metallo-hydrolase [Deltaproteobacteria bacterium]|nr:MBL fold metallo-hydrolase [Deltaproteobacteria bacterium]